jgi:predicted N-formylglutamate amidohydrolase
VEERCAAGARALIAVHTYDPRRRVDAAVRPWPVGLLWRRENPLAGALARRLAEDASALPLGINEPYEIEDASDFTIPVHGEGRGLPHVLVEVRNDLVRDAAAVARMAGVLARACLDLEVA